MSKALTAIRLEGAELATWGSTYIDCPFCGRKDKMGVTNSPNGILYHCFSTNCGRSGNLDGPTTSSIDQPAKKKRRYVGRTELLEPEDRQYFLDRFDLDVVRYEIMVTDKDEYFLPIWDFEGNRVGEVVRQPTWSGEPACGREGQPGKPKALTYLAGRKLAWYDTKDSAKSILANDDLVVIVEDQISAMKIRNVTGFTAVALLGNWASNLDVKDIRARAHNSCILWLDPDMNAQAFKFAAAFGAQFNDFRVILSVQDPKDLTPDQIRRKLLD